MKYKATLGGARGYVPFGIETAVGHDKADLKEFWHQGRTYLKIINMKNICRQT